MTRILLLLVISAFVTAFPVEKKVQCEGGDYEECEEEEEDEGLPLSMEANSAHDGAFPLDKKEENERGITDLLDDAILVQEEVKNDPGSPMRDELLDMNYPGSS